MGRACSSTSFAVNSHACASVSAFDARLARDSIAPLERPVVPEVYSRAASEFGLRQSVAWCSRLRRSWSALSNRFHSLDAAPPRDRHHLLALSRPDDSQAGRGIAEEIFEFRERVRGVEWNEGRAHVASRRDTARRLRAISRPAPRPDRRARPATRVSAPARRRTSACHVAHSSTDDRHWFPGTGVRDACRAWNCSHCEGRRGEASHRQLMKRERAR